MTRWVPWVLVIGLLAVNLALGQRPQPREPQQQARQGLSQSSPGRYQITSGVSLTGSAKCLYILDTTTADMFCLDNPQISAAGPRWAITYAGNVAQMVGNVQR